MIIWNRSLVSAAMDDLRGEFPVFERLAYLNAGTNGPVPRRALDAARASLERQAADGRAGSEFFEGLLARIDDLRARAGPPDGSRPGRGGPHRLHHRRRERGARLARPRARVTRCSPRTRSTPACGAHSWPRANAAVCAVRVVPFAELAGGGPTGHEAGGLLARLLDLRAGDRRGRPGGRRRARAARRRPGPRRGAGERGGAGRGLLRRLGPEMAVRAERHRLPVRAPGGASRRCRRRGRATARSRTPSTPFETTFREDARRFDMGFPGEHQLDWAIAAIDVLVEAGLERLQATARERAALAGRTPGRRRAHGRAAGRLDARLLRGSRPARDGGRPAPRAASCCGTCPARPTCAPRWAPGTARKSWNGCAASA